MEKLLGRNNWMSYIKIYNKVKDNKFQFIVQTIPEKIMVKKDKKIWVKVQFDSIQDFKNFEWKYLEAFDRYLSANFK